MDALTMATIACQVYALWVRRQTWHCPWDRAITLAILLQALSLLIMSPLTSDRLFHRATGLRNLDDVIGHVLLLQSIAALAYAVLARLDDDLVARRRLWRTVMRPNIVGPPVMLILYSKSPVSHDDSVVNLIDAQPNLWLSMYWLTGCAIFGCMMISVLPGLVTLCHDTRRPNVAPIMLCSIGLLLVGALLVISSQFVTHPDSGLMQALTRLSAAILALSASYSWRRKSLVLQSRTVFPYTRRRLGWW